MPLPSLSPRALVFMVKPACAVQGKPCRCLRGAYCGPALSDILLQLDRNEEEKDVNLPKEMGAWEGSVERAHAFPDMGRGS